MMQEMVSTQKSESFWQEVQCKRNDGAGGDIRMLAGDSTEA